jgi:hypothetical protein
MDRNRESHGHLLIPPRGGPEDLISADKRADPQQNAISAIPGRIGSALFTKGLQIYPSPPLWRGRINLFISSDARERPNQGATPTSQRRAVACDSCNIEEFNNRTDGKISRHWGIQLYISVARRLFRKTFRTHSGHCALLQINSAAWHQDGGTSP